MTKDVHYLVFGKEVRRLSAAFKVGALMENDVREIIVLAWGQRSLFRSGDSIKMTGRHIILGLRVSLEGRLILRANVGQVPIYVVSGTLNSKIRKPIIVILVVRIRLRHRKELHCALEVVVRGRIGLFLIVDSGLRGIQEVPYSYGQGFHIIGAL